VTPADVPRPAASLPAAPLPAEYFDGLSARARPVHLRIAHGHLHIEPDRDHPLADGRADGLADDHADDHADDPAAAPAGARAVLALRLPLTEVRWPERTRHSARVAHFSAGGSVRALDAGAWDAWLRAAGIEESSVVAAQQSWRRTAAAVLLLLALAAAGFQWGVPWLARAALAALPAAADRAIGDAALRSFDAVLLLPSGVPVARQQAVREAFTQAVARTYPAGRRPVWELHFHTSPRLVTGADATAPKAASAPDAASSATQPGPPTTRLGPNAFALPGGTIVVTDEMLQLLAGRDDVLLGVLGHELGHVRRRHGMRLLVQATLIGTAASIAWGDFSAVLAAAPALLGQSAYSRDFEREADADAITLLRANGLSPAVMVELFERLAASRAAPGGAGQGGAFDLGIALASHPADAERMQRFKAAAAR
jgi:Zn-dependent protease with chaperone function